MAKHGKFDTYEFTLSAYWASAFFNGDTSGMEDDELADFESCCAYLESIMGTSIPCGCADEYSEGHNPFGLNDWNNLSGETLVYTFLVPAKRNVRFWAWVNSSWVKLTLTREREALRWRSGGPTDEGFSYTSEIWEFTDDGSAVERSSHTNARDCDGPIEFYCNSLCALDELALNMTNMAYPSNRFEGKAIRRPNWQDAERYQRDHYAEAMNY